MNPRATNTTLPPIPTGGGRLLTRHAAAVRARMPDFDGHVTAIRAGDNDLLLTYVRATQAGDHEASTLTLWAIHPRMCAVIRSRFAHRMWNAAADTCLTLLYLTIIDVRADETSDYLSDKLVARTRRRYERLLAADQPEPLPNEELLDLGPVADDVALRALARLELADLRAAVADGLVTERGWHALIDQRLNDRPTPMKGSGRMLVLRAQRRLETWREQAA